MPEDTFSHGAGNIILFFGKNKMSSTVVVNDTLTLVMLNKLTLLLLNTTCPVLANSVDPDQLASSEAN